ncbi:protein AGENET DOMAIN (AGD)-CONTAINING P1 [Diospyros lotus]|uniref:protein AGENET DOMAIN (AGD)-CONTAINING P1 n=1 Tax=Diospyros lotus TaxID=55363 RepID=UPI002254E286|nr:protein AGENET DOMAIN (AGD)-CONTAINING P1 [Diospyros lotus]
MEEEEEEWFKKGGEVEVSLEEEGFRGSWYTATVLRRVSKKNYKMLVEFKNLTADEEGTKPLRQFVEAILARPVPPRELNRSFKLSDEVDAFHNDGWWEGIVTAVYPMEEQRQDSSTRRYSVFFRSSREQIDFPQSDLRLHREWFHGKWVPPLEQEE